MKKLHLLLLGLTICLFSACHDDIWEAIDGLDSRVTKLEELCKEMNTNITSLQTIVDVLRSNDFITDVVEIKKDGEVIGYAITFGKHDPITIYHGQDGKDGADGKDGQDGSTPVIGVAQDTDGVYYWTLNGEWILDDNGNKLPVSGKDGQNGTNGQDGKDGITPQLKIEDRYWHISYDNGATWTQLGKAAGEDGKNGTDGEDGKDGQNGADGKDGQNGDSMFQSVTQDENYVYFTLADGTMIKICKCSSDSKYIFTITYDPNGGIGTMLKDTFYYGHAKEISECAFTNENLYFSNWNTSPTGSGAPFEAGYSLNIDKDIVLYAQWGETPWHAVDMGLSVKWASCNVGATKAEDIGLYYAWGELETKEQYDLYTYKWYDIESSMMTKYNFYDCEYILRSIDDVATVNWGSDWRMPTVEEWEELRRHCTFQRTTKNGVEGCKITSTNGNHIFLPNTGYIDEKGNTLGTNYYGGEEGIYWSSSTYIDPSVAIDIDRAYSINLPTGYISPHDRENGLAVRPVLGKLNLPMKPIVRTFPDIVISENTITLEGEIIDCGTSMVTQCGFIIGTSPDIEVYSEFTSDDNEGVFSMTIDNLSFAESTGTYYVRAYAINDVGIAYGELVSFVLEEIEENEKSEGIGIFSVSVDKQVTFSPGNLQYTKSTNTWSFASTQYEMLGTDNVIGGSAITDSTGVSHKHGSALANKIDLFYWSTSISNFGISTYNNDYSGHFVDWGTNKIGNDAPNTWRTLTCSEWEYLRYNRTNADDLIGVAQINGINGLIILPDDWICPLDISFKSGFAFYSDYGIVETYNQYQTFTDEEWIKLESTGAVFLPATGNRVGLGVFSVQRDGFYWGIEDTYNDANGFSIDAHGACRGSSDYSIGNSVRLVKDL